MAVKLPIIGDWYNTRKLNRYTFHCGYCGDKVGAREGYSVDPTHGDIQQLRSSGYPVVLICPTCNCATFFADTNWTFQSPPPTLGRAIISLPIEIHALYEEARSCTKVNAYTSCILTCRKLLMHLAVEKGAAPNLSFLKYVEWLADNHWVPPNGRPWVDHIRLKGNEANHDIVIMDQQAASEILAFVEMLLVFMYEFPARLNPPATP